MLFIDYKQSEIFEYHTFRKDSMGCNDTIKSSICESLQDLSGFFRRTKSSQNSEANSEVSQSFCERFHVLIGEHYQWRDEDRLFSIEKSTKDSVHSYFCFSESYIARKESVHRIARLHVCEDFRNRCFLINSICIRKV